VLKIGLASGVMAAAAWSLSAGIEARFPTNGSALYSAQVVAATGVAGIVFYLSCRVLKIKELDEAMDAIAGPLLRAAARVRK
jgi:hypothetical protein